MELRHLRYFVAVADLESFTKASASLCVSQSALSRQIALLEKEIGVALFARTGKRIGLSREGKLFRREAMRLLTQSQKLKSLFRHRPGTRLRSITVGAPQTVGHVLFPRLKRRFATTCPHVSLAFVEGLSDQLCASLGSGAIDLAVSAFIEADINVEAHLIAKEPIFLVGAARGETRSGESCDLRAAFAIPLIVPVRGSRERLHWETVARNRGLRLQVAAEVDNVDLAKIMMREGEGCMLLPAPAVREFARDQAVVVTPVRKLTVPRMIAVRRGREEDADIAALKTLIVDEVEALAKPSALAA